MCKVDEQDEPKQHEGHRANEGEVLAPYLEEGFWDEESENDEGEPDQGFRTPVTVLKCCATVFGGLYAEEEEGEEKVEKAKGEIDTLDGDVAVALFALASYCHVV